MPDPACCDPRQHECLCGLSPDLREALRRIIAKNRKGATEHGPLNVHKGEWLAAMLEEQIDLSMYSIFQLMKMERESALNSNVNRTSHGGWWDGESRSR